MCAMNNHHVINLFAHMIYIRVCVFTHFALSVTACSNKESVKLNKCVNKKNLGKKQKLNIVRLIDGISLESSY